MSKPMYLTLGAHPYTEQFVDLSKVAHVEYRPPVTEGKEPTKGEVRVLFGGGGQITLSGDDAKEFMDAFRKIAKPSKRKLKVY
jgi:hypothetical protein